MDLTPEEQEFAESSKKYAEENNFALNPEEQIVEAITKGLFKRKELNGELYCPCRAVSGNVEKDKDIICPCVYHKDEIAKDGHCHCNLFVK